MLPFPLIFHQLMNIFKILTCSGTEGEKNHVKNSHGIKKMLYYSDLHLISLFGTQGHLL